MAKVKKINTTSKPSKGILGNTGALLSGGLPYSEPLSELQFPNSVDVYRKMYTQDSVVAGLINNIISIFTNLKPIFDRDDEIISRTFSAINFHQIQHEFASAFIYGFHAAEIIYNIERDGVVIAIDLEPRNQASIEKISYRDNKVYQYHMNIDDDPPKPIPISKCVIWSIGSFCRDPYGISLLRHSYVPWYYKSVIQATEAQSVDRDLGGFPVIYAPAGFDFSAADSSAPNYDVNIARTLRYMMQLGEKIRKGTQACAVLPDGWKVELLRPSGSSFISIDKTIARYNNEIAVSMLSTFLSNAFSSTNQANVSVSSEYLLNVIDSYAAQFASVLQEQLINRLAVYNNIPEDEVPKISFMKTRKAEIKDLASFVARLVSQGAIRPTDKLEKTLLDLAGLPDNGKPIQVDGGDK